MQWYYSIDGQRLGPVVHTELERLVQAGTITDDTLLWRQGMDQWKTFEQVRTRDPAMFAAVPPPLPEQPGVGEGEAPAPVRRPMRLEPEETKPVAPEVLLYAGFWRRAGAFGVDFLLWGLVWQILTAVLGSVFFPDAIKLLERINTVGAWSYRITPEEVAVLAPFYGALMLVTIVWAVLYDLIFIPRFAATPGKLLFGLRLVSTNNKPLGFGRIVARSLARVLSGFPTFFIGFLIVAFEDQKRGLHDFLCGTRVVKKR